MSKFDFLDKLDVSTEYFKNEFDKVILWNEVALNGRHSYSPAVIERQYGLCLEEYKEFVEVVAIMKSKGYDVNDYSLLSDVIGKHNDIRYFKDHSAVVVS